MHGNYSNLSVLFLSAGEEVDGETMIMLAQEGTMQQMVKCGLKTIKDQMKLKKVVRHAAASSSSGHKLKCNTSTGRYQLRQLQ